MLVHVMVHVLIYQDGRALWFKAHFSSLTHTFNTFGETVGIGIVLLVVIAYQQCVLFQ